MEVVNSGLSRTENVDQTKRNLTFGNGIQYRHRSAARCLGNVSAKAQSGAQICRPDNRGGSAKKGSEAALSTDFKFFKHGATRWKSYLAHGIARSQGIYEEQVTVRSEDSVAFAGVT